MCKKGRIIHEESLWFVVAVNKNKGNATSFLAKTTTINAGYQLGAGEGVEIPATDDGYVWFYVAAYPKSWMRELPSANNAKGDVYTPKIYNPVTGFENANKYDYGFINNHNKWAKTSTDKKPASYTDDYVYVVFAAEKGQATTNLERTRLQNF